MKTTSAPFAPRYRNDAVFRSAERLLATPPAKRPSPRPARWLVFLAGLVLGAALGTYGWKLWHGSVTSPEASAPPAAIRARLTSSDPRSRAAAQAASAETTPAESASAAGSSREDPAGPVTESTGALRGLAGNRMVTPAEFLNAGTAATPLEWMTAPAIQIVLRGELRAENAKPIACEFVLRQPVSGATSTVTGLVRFLSGDYRWGSYSLLGKIEGRVLHLRETETVWSVRELTAETWVRASQTPSSRLFELHFPQTFSTSTTVTGTWMIGANSGTLVLNPATLP